METEEVVSYIKKHHPEIADEISEEVIQRQVDTLKSFGVNEEENLKQSVIKVMKIRKEHTQCSSPSEDENGMKGIKLNSIRSLELKALIQSPR